MKTVIFFALCLLLAASPVSAQLVPAPIQHPQIQQIAVWWDFDWELREHVLVVDVDVVLDDGPAEMAGTVTFRSHQPHQLDDWSVTRSFDPRLRKSRQLKPFAPYSIAILSCQFDLPAAHVYDRPTTHNPNSPMTIFDYADALAWIPWCRQYTPVPPPPNGLREIRPRQSLAANRW